MYYNEDHNDRVKSVNKKVFDIILKKFDLLQISTHKNTTETNEYVQNE